MIESSAGSYMCWLCRPDTITDAASMRADGHKAWGLRLLHRKRTASRTCRRVIIPLDVMHGHGVARIF